MGDPAQALAGLPAGRLAIAVPDLTRPCEVGAALAALREAHAGPATVVVGLGLHRPLTEAELAPLRAFGWPVLNHDPDRCVDLGEEAGFPCLVHPAVAEAEAVVAVGVVELHQYAGFSGGHKAVAVGCGGRATLAALHARELVCHPEVAVGKLEGNPFRAAVDALGRRAGCAFALQQVPGRGWVGGEPVAALRAAAEALDPWEMVDGRWASAILRVPPSKAANLYQASRAATYLGLSPRPPLEDGALLVLDAACPEGAGQGQGEQDFARLLASVPPPWGALMQGEAPRGAGMQRAWMFARLAERFRLVVAGCARPELLRALGVDATAAAAEDVAGPGALVVERPFTRLPQVRG